MSGSEIAKKDVKEKYEERHSKTVGSDIIDAKFNKWLINTVRNEVKERRTLLDVACGRGNWLKECQEMGIDCYGLDLSKAGLTRAKERLDFTELFWQMQKSYHFAAVHLMSLLVSEALSIFRIQKGALKKCSGS